MSLIDALKRETLFAAKDRTLWFWLMLVFCLSSVSVVTGLIEVNRQHVLIEQLVDSDKQDRDAVAKKLTDWGSAAYYSFHLTYDSPSSLAYAAMGQRDVQPWKHRVRMLALEGQIYERDVGSPSVALIGRFDFAFFAAFIMPLVLITLLYDLRAGEKTAGRYNVLEATARGPFSLWFLRAVIKTAGVFLCLVIPFFIAGIVAGAGLSQLGIATLYLFVYTLFWAVVCVAISDLQRSGVLILMVLIIVWLLSAVILPTTARLVIDRLVAVPTGAEILLVQRETVNDAWDLPREETMQLFFSRHPEWSNYAPVDDGSFEWQWYYAFQQVGDQQAESLSMQLRQGKQQRNRLAARVSLLTPPSLLERSLQSLANTDWRASMAYEEEVRSYHARLREFYYPKFFRNEPFDKSQLEKLPQF